MLTADRREDILAAGGSGDWVLNTDKAAPHRYLVCCRKSRWDNKADGIAGPRRLPDRHHQELGKAPGPSNRAGQHRYLIELSQLRLVENASVWDPTWRNPVGYASLPASASIRSALDFKPIDTGAATDAGRPAAAPQRLTIAEAKKALAESFGVRPEDIEINIRG